MTQGRLVAMGLAALLAPTLADRALAVVPVDPDSPELLQGARDLGARLTVPVTINGGGPYHFVVDTAAERTVISRELVGRLALAPGTDVTVLSIAGSEPARTAMVGELRLTSGRSGLSDLEAPIMDERDLGALGLLGIDSLKTKRVDLDFRAMRMTIADAAKSARAQSGEIVVTARRKHGQLILVDSTVEGIKVNVVIDTGSQVTIGNPALRAALETRKRLQPPIPITIIGVTGARALADYTAIGATRIGGVLIKNLPVAFADIRVFGHLGLSERPALLLGMDALRGFDRVSVDFANKSVRFVLPGDALHTPPPVLANADRPAAG